MKYEFYVDVFFLTNFYLDFLAVYAVSEMLRQKKKLLRYLVSCALSSLIGCILYLVLTDYDMYLLCMHFIVNPGMVFLSFFPAEKRIYGKAFCLMYFVILLLGGSVEWLYQTVAKGHFYELCLLLSAIPVIALLYMLRRKRKNVQGFYPVRIEHNGRNVTLQGLYDTGNRLLDPYRKEAVHIVSKKTFEDLGGKENFSTRLIPFSSVGCQNGMLEAFTVEHLWIDWEGVQIERSPCVLAAAEDMLFQNRSYQMILHGSIIESMERKEENVCT